MDIKVDGINNIVYISSISASGDPISGSGKISLFSLTDGSFINEYRLWPGKRTTAISMAIDSANSLIYIAVASSPGDFVNQIELYDMSFVSQGIIWSYDYLNGLGYYYGLYLTNTQIIIQSYTDGGGYDNKLIKIYNKWNGSSFDFVKSIIDCTVYPIASLGLIGTDGTNIYIADGPNKNIKSFALSDGSLVETIGAGIFTSDPNFCSAYGSFVYGGEITIPNVIEFGPTSSPVGFLGLSFNSSGAGNSGKRNRNDMGGLVVLLKLHELIQQEEGK